MGQSKPQVTSEISADRPKKIQDASLFMDNSDRE